jgi:hypothetical protein|tara:strand:- start:635 stop:811 length:177 start_codon:yes stop_codon:yes gene_type:complete
MKNIYTLTEKSMKFWLNLFTPKNEGIIKFCKIEYGNDWQWAYSHFQKNKTLPKFKEAA